MDHTQALVSAVIDQIPNEGQGLTHSPTGGRSTEGCCGDSQGLWGERGQVLHPASFEGAAKLVPKLIELYCLSASQRQ